MADEWWKNAVIYQIYPRSFRDTNGDGIGDLEGIIEQLPYIVSLGVDCLWLCPFLESPMKDFGYDVSDYRRVDPVYGDEEALSRLIAKVHENNLRILIDLAFNHTSDHHKWFEESRKSSDNPKADWYVWADAREDGTAPNNWLSIFGGLAWTFDESRGQYYYHNFLSSQPDLNFYNPEVQEAVLDILRYWLDQGFDGCRLDACNAYMHDRQLRDNPPNTAPGVQRLHMLDNYNMQRHLYNKTQPENIEFIKKIRAVLDEYPGTFGVGEIDDQCALEVLAQYTASEELLHSGYTFTQSSGVYLPDAEFFRGIVEKQRSQSGDSFPSWMFSNHDIIRAPSRWFDGEYGYDSRLSSLLVILLGCLRGVILLYQGDELGLPQADIPVAQLKDPWGKYLYPKWKGRDGSRVPMPWNGDSATAGFTQGEPWLPIPQSYLELAVSEQDGKPESTLSITRAFLHWRRDRSAFMQGDIAFLDDLPHRILGIRRNSSDETVLCLFNLSGNEQRLARPAGIGQLITVDGVPATTLEENEELILAPYATAFFCAKA